MREAARRLASATCCGALLLATGCMNQAPSPPALVSGTATYRERIALPPTAVFEATLEDVSRADARADVLGSTRKEAAGNPPYRFTIDYDPARIDPSHRYSVRARILVDGQLMFTTDTHHPVLTQGQPSQVDIVLRRASSGAATGSGEAAASRAIADASLENTYWKLVALGPLPVSVAENQREPHLVLQSEPRRVGGSGGCNRLTGSYTLDGDKLGFGQMAGTMMACAQGMEVEQAFHAALRTVATWRIQGETLEVFDEHGASVARFEARYMK